MGVGGPMDELKGLRNPNVAPYSIEKLATSIKRIRQEFCSVYTSHGQKIFPIRLKISKSAVGCR